MLAQSRTRLGPCLLCFRFLIIGCPLFRSLEAVCRNTPNTSHQETTKGESPHSSHGLLAILVHRMMRPRQAFKHSTMVLDLFRSLLPSLRYARSKCLRCERQPVCRPTLSKIDMVHSVWSDGFIDLLTENDKRCSINHPGPRPPRRCDPKVRFYQLGF